MLPSGASASDDGRARVLIDTDDLRETVRGWGFFMAHVTTVLRAPLRGDWQTLFGFCCESRTSERRSRSTFFPANTLRAPFEPRSGEGKSIDAEYHRVG